MKTCTICGKEKPLSEFRPSKTGKGGLDPRCWPCHRTYLRDWRRANADQVNAAAAGYEAARCAARTPEQRAERARVERERYAAKRNAARAEAERQELEEKERLRAAFAEARARRGEGAAGFSPACEP